MVGAAAVIHGAHPRGDTTQELQPRASLIIPSEITQTRIKLNGRKIYFPGREAMGCLVLRNNRFKREGKAIPLVSISRSIIVAPGRDVTGCGEEAMLSKRCEPLLDEPSSSGPGRKQNRAQHNPQPVPAPA